MEPVPQSLSPLETKDWTLPRGTPASHREGLSCGASVPRRWQLSGNVGGAAGRLRVALRPQRWCGPGPQPAPTPTHCCCPCSRAHGVSSLDSPLQHSRASWYDMSRQLRFFPPNSIRTHWYFHSCLQSLKQVAGSGGICGKASEEGVQVRELFTGEAS